MIYILAEIASAHMGDPDLCLELIHKAKEAGADGVKVQVWFPDEGDFSHMMDKKIWPWGFLDDAPRGFDLWGQYYGGRSKAVCEAFCDATINGHDKSKIEMRRRFMPDIHSIHGNQEYPTPICNCQLRSSLGGKGYADHTKAAQDIPTGAVCPGNVVIPPRWDFVIPAMAIAAGATLIEKHICLNREELKPKSKDWVSALEPHEFKEFVQFIREAETAL